MSGYGKIFAVLCLADLFSTVFLLKFNFIKEENPVLSFYLNNFGLAGFVAIKLFLNALSIFVLESIFLFSLIPERRMRIYYKAIIFGFLAFYFLAGIAVNVLI